MDSIRIAKLTEKFQTGLLTSYEVVNALMNDFVSENEMDLNSLRCVKTLPGAVKKDFRILMEEIEQLNFRWAPSLIPASREDPNKNSTRLKQICSFIRENCLLSDER